MSLTLNRAFLIFALLLLFSAGCEKLASTDSAAKNSAPAEALNKTAEKGPVRMTVRLSPKEARLSDLLDLDIIVQFAQDVEIKPPEFGRAVGDFLISDYAEKKEKPQDNLQVRHFHYKLEPVHAGKHLIRSISVQFTDKRPGNESKGEPGVLESEPLEVNITSELGDKAPSLADLTPMQPPQPLPPRAIWKWILGGIGALVVIGAIIAWWRARKEAAFAPEIQRSPEEIAAEELKQLLAENLHGKGLYKDFYVRLTGIVRRYIERTTGIHAPEQTTEEFLNDMRSRKVFPEDRSTQFANFLEAADMVKYAGQEPGQRQIEESIARAQEFVGLPSAFRPMPELAGAAK